MFRLLLCAALITTVAYGDAESTFHPYANHMLVGDANASLTNTGALGGFDPAGRICANVYVFDPAQEFIGCCACLVKPDELRSFSEQNDLFTNVFPTPVVIQLIASAPASSPVGSTCNPAAVKVSSLVGGLRAWGTSLHVNTFTGRYSTISRLSVTEFVKMQQDCAFTQANGNAAGICDSCRVGAGD